MTFASQSIAEHVVRGFLGFTALAGAAWSMTMNEPLAAAPLAIAGFVLLRGCPTCWTIGLFETLSSKHCSDGTCGTGRFEEP